jgi:hypothetical protein
MEEAVALSPFATTLWVLAGILISLVLPVAVKTLQSAQGRLEDAEKPTLWEKIVAAWKQYGGNKYLMVFLAAVVVAVVMVFLLGLKFYTPRDAGLAGFAWESLVNKLFAKQQPPDDGDD